MATEKKLTYEYIRGLVDGEGTFTFSTSHKLNRKVPAFSIKMHVRDKQLLEMVRDTMGLRNKIYEYNHQGKDGANRGPQAMLIVREFGQLKNIIVPFFYKRLKGDKGRQFNEWLEKIGDDPEVPESYRFIYKIYKAGFYDKNPKYWD
jgi:LAGLIDADG endonuclease